MGEASNKIYLREVASHGSDSLDKVIQRIAPGSTVLDLGCGPGVLGARLTQRRCVVDGLEANGEAVALGAAHYRKMVVADLESQPLAAHFPGARYDYIVCADVLEHLRDPQKLVAQLPALLSPSGRILLSIPNIGYAGVVGALINGEFEYRSEGLLDDTHLRFFTRKSLMAFIARCELDVVHVDTVGMPLDQSEFRDSRVDSLPPAVSRTLLAMPDALTYQFIVETAPVGRERRAPVVQQADVPAFGFTAQLHHRGNHPFDAQHVTTVHGRMGVDRQRLVFAIPPSELQALRLDPSNRPGYLRIFDMSLFSADGACAWKWDPAQSLDKQRRHELAVVPDEEGVLFVCEGDDPWIELPVAAADLAPLRGGGRLELDVAWPQSHDSYVAIRKLTERSREPGRLEELQRLNGDMRAHIRTLTTEIRELQNQLRAARATIAAINSSLTFRVAKPLHAIVNRLRK